MWSSLLFFVFSPEKRRKGRVTAAAIRWLNLRYDVQFERNALFVFFFCCKQRIGLQRIRVTASARTLPSVPQLTSTKGLEKVDE